jgi:hypothetical protein
MRMQFADQLIQPTDILWLLISNQFTAPVPSACAAVRQRPHPALSAKEWHEKYLSRRDCVALAANGERECRRRGTHLFPIFQRL